LGVLPGAGGEQKEAREKYAQGLLILVVNEALSRFRKAANGPRPVVPRPCRGGEMRCVLAPATGSFTAAAPARSNQQPSPEPTTSPYFPRAATLAPTLPAPCSDSWQTPGCP
jgi:hypothetical protein